MKTTIFLFATILYACSVNAQVGITFDANAPGVGGYGNVSFTNPGTIGVKATETVDDADVAGSPYFDERWARAIIILDNNQAVRINKARLNLYKGELRYMDSFGMELVALAGAVKKVFFFDSKDTAKVTAVFQQISGVDTKAAPRFIQVLNSGKAELLKLTQVFLNDKGFDAAAGKNDYSFISKASYYLLNGSVVTALKGADKDAVLSVITPTADINNWLKANNNKLKGEKDILSFLAYYNGAN